MSDNSKQKTIYDIFGKQPQNKVDENNPWGLPDWRQRENYPYKVMHVAFWKWEFTRRNRDYQNDWLEFQKNKNQWQEPNEKGLTEEELVAKKYRRHHLRHPNSNIQSYSMKSLQKAILDTNVIDAGDNLYYAKIFAEIASNENKLLIAINPTLSLDGQWKQIKKTIIDEQLGKNKTKVHPEKYSLYLRILDAELEVKDKKTTWKQVVAVLINEEGTKHLNEENIFDIQKQARETLKKITYEW